MKDLTALGEVEAKSLQRRRGAWLPRRGKHGIELPQASSFCGPINMRVSRSAL
jgi:hypothetical protein